MTSHATTGLLACLAATVLAFAAVPAPAAHAAEIDFDDVSVSPNTATFVSSSHYAPQGVTIQTVLDIGDGLVVGNSFTPVVSRNDFLVANFASSISKPNLALADRVTNGFITFASDEVLFTFASRQSGVSLNSDNAPLENPDVIRLLGLRNLGGGEFEVIAAIDGLDNQTTPAASLLSISCPGGCDAAM